MDNQSLCIIPARGGSKRIPRKNIRQFLGKPIISYSIYTAQKSMLFDEIMVSTDDLEIQQISLEYGAKVPFLRSSKNADDHATTVDVVNEVLEYYYLKGKKFKTICVLYPCAPLVSDNDLKMAFSMLDSYEAILPITKYSFSPFRSFKKIGNTLTYNWPEYEKSRSQDLDPLYHDAGQWYLFKNNQANHHTSMIKSSTYGFILESTNVQDIDDENDWKLSELKYRLIHEKL